MYPPCGVSHLIADTDAEKQFSFTGKCSGTLLHYMISLSSLKIHLLESMTKAVVWIYKTDISGGLDCL